MNRSNRARPCAGLCHATVLPVILGIALIGVAGAQPGPGTAARPARAVLSPSAAGPGSAETLAHLETLGPAAAQRKIWVYFTDKRVTDDAVRERRLAAIAAGLDPHAMERRRKALGPALVDEYDLPVAADYRLAVERLGATVCRESRWLNAVSVRASLRVLREIAALPFVARLALVARGRGLPPPEPPQMLPAPGGSEGGSRRFDYGPSYDQLEEIGVIAAHDAGWSGAGVRVCMMDTGYWREHPTFETLLSEGRLIGQWDFINDDDETQDEPGDPEGQHNHGTTTWSLVGAFTETELIGVAYGAEFLLAKTEDVADEYPAEEDNWIAAMEWADAQGADILSTSLNYILWYTYEDMDGDTAPITIAADVAVSRGMVACVAAGNWATQDWYYIGAPADGDSVIAVGAMEPDGSMWSDSSHGPTYDGRIKPEVCARGASTYSAVVPGGHGGDELFRNVDGTSVSCPQVAGAAALLLEAHPSWSAMMVREALMMTANNADNPDNDQGWGRIDVGAALGYGASAPEIPVPAMPAAALRATPNPTRGGVFFSVAGRPPGSGAGRLHIYAADGSEVARLHTPGGEAAVHWSGSDQRGRPVAPGIYFARWWVGDTAADTRLLIIR